ncbi:MAG TPA: DedA family protein [Azospirillaceae bacterium]|nr:DedA family protein [Azospirillaceae bacterium]
MDVYALLEQYGDWVYLGAFINTFFEGETLILVGGFAAAQDLLDPIYLALTAWAGSFLGDQLYFAIGRRYGFRLVARRPRLKAGVETAILALHRWHTPFILGFRFLYGIRTVASFALGMTGIGWARFALLNFVAAGVWAWTFVGVGYLFGEAMEAMFGSVAKSVQVMLLGILALVGCSLLLARFLSRRAAPAAVG